MSDENIQQEKVDEETGEVLAHYGNSGFLMIFKDHLHLLSEVTGEKRIKVLVYMLKNMNRHNMLSRKQSQIADELDLTRSYVSRVLTAFEKAELCVNGRGWYMVNPRFVFYGKAHRKRKAIRIFSNHRTEKKHG